MTKAPHKQTRIVRAGIGIDTPFQSIIPPIYLSSTFQRNGIGEPAGKYGYSRICNPTRDILSDAISDIEGGIGGCITSSGMAAITLILHLLNPNDLLLAPYDCYGRTMWLLRALAKKGHFKLKLVDQYSETALNEAFTEPPRMVLIETPSNPVLRIADIKSIVNRAKAHNALVVVDNTFLSPILQNPLTLGADIVFHSSTKFLNGHSDIIGGAVIVNTQELLDELDLWNNSLGTIGAPFDSYMILRGMRTLEIRIHRAEDNAQKIADFLENHANIEKVHYPGLKSHTGHKIAKKQQNGFGSMLSFEIKGTYEQTKLFVKTLNIFALAQSLGGTESMINHPATMTHASMDEKSRTKAGITNQLLRLSIGIEHVDDLINDLNQAL